MDRVDTAFGPTFPRGNASEPGDRGPLAKERPCMTTAQIFALADACIEAGIFPGLKGKRFVLVLVIEGTGRAIIHRNEVSFLIFCPCRVWVMCGKVRVLLGDEHALPLDLSSGTRPPWTG